MRGVDCISKKIDKKDIRNIIELQTRNTAFVCTLNNVELIENFNKYLEKAEKALSENVEMNLSSFGNISFLLI